MRNLEYCYKKPLQNELQGLSSGLKRVTRHLHHRNHRHRTRYCIGSSLQRLGSAGSRNRNRGSSRRIVLIVNHPLLLGLGVI